MKTAARILSIAVLVAGCASKMPDLSGEALESLQDIDYRYRPTTELALFESVPVVMSAEQ